MKLEITKERVLEAASKCSTAKATLELLFPEAFVDDKSFNFKGVQIAFDGLPYGFKEDSIEVRTDSSFKYKGFYLSSSINWEIKVDSAGIQVLIPTKR